MFKTSSKLNVKEHVRQKTLQSFDYEPKRLALNYRPPMIILEFTLKSTGKLYHRRMKIRKINTETDTKKVLRGIKKRYARYFIDGKIKDNQMTRLIDKLKNGIQINNNSSLVFKKKRNPSMIEGSNSMVISKVNKENKTQSNRLKESGITKLNEEMMNFSHKKQPVVTTIDDKEKDLLSHRKKEEMKEEFNDEFDDLNDGFDDLDEDFDTIGSEFDDGFDEIEDDGFDEIEDDDLEEKNSQKEEELDILEEPITEISNLSQKNLNELDLNKYNSHTVDKIKQKMDEQFLQKQVNKGDEGFTYDKRQEFNPDESNEWDDESFDF